MNSYNNYILNQNDDSHEYNGGYSIQSLLSEEQMDKSKQTGGDGHIKFSQFQDLVIPIGLVLDNRCHSLTQKYVDVFDEGYEHKYVETAFFDKMLYSMNNSIEKGSNSRKNNHIVSMRKTKKNN
jgi:hypothetical protein